jgi:Conserved hypothetical protein 698
VVTDLAAAASPTGTVRRSAPGRRAIALVPGVALLFAIGYAGKYAEASLRAYGKSHHVAVPNIEYVLWAIVFGLVVGNALAAGSRLRAVFAPGIDTYEFFLKLGIALLGSASCSPTWSSSGA